MSKRQKGRKHRKVNRTPRPVGPAGRVTATRATARATASPRPTATDDRPAAPVPEPSHEPRPAGGREQVREPRPVHERASVGASEAASGSAPSSRPAPTPADLGALFRTPARDGGLGQSAARTWNQVRRAGAAGTTVEELAAEVGYQARTVLKHLQGLAEHGMVEECAPDRWRPAHTTPDAPDADSGTAADGRVPQHA
ncbi:hypothetical protein SALCHL_005634 [Streptomyces albus subsp. chlorinus]|uniref:hypothetical protein n=1 Tax=Streptomyces albus TaxID=1888 RepID=UPI003D0C0678